MDKSLLYDLHFNGFEKQLGVHPIIVAWIDEVILRGQFHPFAQIKDTKRPLNAKNSIRSVESDHKNEEEETKATFVPPFKQAFVEPHKPPEKPKLFDAFKDIFKK